jgi:hypothetical protein
MRLLVSVGFGAGKSGQRCGELIDVLALVPTRRKRQHVDRDV